MRNWFAHWLAGSHIPDARCLPRRHDNPLDIGAESSINSLSVSLNRSPQELGGLAIPYVDLVAGCADNSTAIRGKERRFETALVRHQCASGLATLRIPNSNRKIVIRHENGDPVRTKRCRKRSGRLRDRLR